MTNLLVVRKGEIGTVVNAAIAAQKAFANGIAPLDADSKVPADNVRFGTEAGTVAQGDDGRLSDTRTPADASVTNAKVAATAAIAESKLALASDATANTASRRTLGTGALQAAAGNDSRLHSRNHNLFSTDHADVDETDTPANLEVLTFDAAAGKWRASPAGGVLSADESREGTTRQSTAQQIIDGTPGNRFATVARLKAELDRRQTARRSTTRVAAHAVNNVNLAAGAELTTADLRGLGTPPIPADAIGVEVILMSSGTVGTLVVDSADVTPSTFSPRIQFHSSLSNVQLSVPLGTGVNAGKITLKAISAASSIYLYPVGWWR